MKRTCMTLAMCCVVSAGVLAQGPEPTRPGDRNAGQPRRDASSDSTDTRTFVNTMAVAGMAEVQLGKLASERAASADVKAFGQMMVADHTKANEELKALALRLNVPLPTALDPKHRDLAARLSTLKGAAFDREYMTAMVTGHEEVAATLKTRARSADRSISARPSTEEDRAASGAPAGTRPATEPPNAPSSSPTRGGTAPVGTGGSAQGEEALTQWASKTLPTVEQHLQRARTLQGQTGK